MSNPLLGNKPGGLTQREEILDDSRSGRDLVEGLLQVGEALDGGRVAVSWGSFPSLAADGEFDSSEARLEEVDGFDGGLIEGVLHGYVYDLEG